MTLTPEALAEIRALAVEVCHDLMNRALRNESDEIPDHRYSKIYRDQEAAVRALLAEVTWLQAENERLESERARWHRLAQELLTELNTVYERIDSCLPEGPTWGNILARVSAAGAEIKRLHAELARYTAHRETGFQGRGE